MEAVTSPDFQHVLLSSQAVVCLHAAAVRVHVQIIYSLKEGWDIWNWKDNKRSTFSSRCFWGSCKFILTYRRFMQKRWTTKSTPDSVPVVCFCFSSQKHFTPLHFFSPLQTTILCHGPNHFMRQCNKKKTHMKIRQSSKKPAVFPAAGFNEGQTASSPQTNHSTVCMKAYWEHPTIARSTLKTQERFKANSSAIKRN